MFPHISSDFYILLFRVALQSGDFFPIKLGFAEGGLYVA